MLSMASLKGSSCFARYRQVSALPTPSSSVKAFGTYASDDPDEKETESQQLKVIMKRATIENIMEQIISCSAILSLLLLVCH